MLLGGVLLWGAVTGLAKDRQPTTRTITGTVFDDAGNTLQGAAIELTDVQTGKVLDIYSQEAGQYRMSDLRFDHDYTIKATYEGSSSEVRRISILETRWTLVLNLTVPKAHK
jgi:ABC-type transporter Mla subunit MlaD